jgi:hypothetical protein
MWILLVVAATFAVHELAHGLAGAALGYDTWVRVNSSDLAAGEWRSARDNDLTSLAGPVVTLLQGLLGLWLVRRGWRPGLVIVLAALMMRVLAAVASLRLPNDEARLGLAWGFGYWGLHALVIGALLVMAGLAVRQVRPGWKWPVATLAGIVVAMIIVVAAEPFLPKLYL